MSAHQPSVDATGGVDVEAWTQSTMTEMQRLRVSTPEPAAIPIPSHTSVRGTAVVLDIPLDAESPLRRRDERGAAEGQTTLPQKPIYRRREPLRRDSLKRREELLKGKEGSRRRRKWENERMLGNPWLEPPQPHDWEPHPTYPVQSVPYFLAPLWDERRAKADLRAAEQQRKRKAQALQAQGPPMPRSLRETLKRARGAKSLLQQLEEQVRDFVEKERLRRQRGAAGAASPTDLGFEELEISDSDEEIVFVGRNGQMHSSRLPPAAVAQARSASAAGRGDKMVFDTLADDSTGGFGRWLVHQIAAYYDLRTYSLTTGNPARREAYIGFKPGCGDEELGAVQLPKPLYGMV